jgi:hypothetical protein
LRLPTQQFFGAGRVRTPNRGIVDGPWKIFNARVVSDYVLHKISELKHGHLFGVSEIDRVDDIGQEEANYPVD